MKSAWRWVIIESDTVINMRYVKSDSCEKWASFNDPYSYSTNSLLIGISFQSWTLKLVPVKDSECFQASCDSAFIPNFILRKHNFKKLCFTLRFSFQSSNSKHFKWLQIMFLFLKYYDFYRIDLKWSILNSEWFCNPTFPLLAFLFL